MNMWLMNSLQFLNFACKARRYCVWNIRWNHEKLVGIMCLAFWALLGFVDTGYKPYWGRSCIPNVFLYPQLLFLNCHCDFQSTSEAKKLYL